MSPLILCIEDEESVSDVIRQSLNLAGYEVMTAACAEDAIAALHTHRPDLILLDLLLPDINGYSLLEYLKESGGPADIPILIVSGCVSPEAVELGFERGAVGYLRKPFRPHHLIQHVNRILGGQTSDCR